MLLCFNMMPEALERVSMPPLMFSATPMFLTFALSQWGAFSLSGASVFLLPKPLHDVNGPPV